MRSWRIRDGLADRETRGATVRPLDAADSCFDASMRGRRLSASSARRGHRGAPLFLGQRRGGGAAAGGLWERGPRVGVAAAAPREDQAQGGFWHAGASWKMEDEGAPEEAGAPFATDLGVSLGLGTAAGRQPLEDP